MKNKLYLIGLIILYIAIIFGICLFKYANNLYNGIDLGIFAQGFQSLVQGDFLYVPLQGTQYWADHFSLMFFIFYPFYYLWQSPLFLLFLQTVFIGLAAWPLYLISKKYLSNKKSFLIVVLFLFNPFVISMNLFEFHLLPLGFFFFFWLFYFYLRISRGISDTPRQGLNRLGFYIFLFLCLFVREDVSIFLFGFAVFMLYEKVKSSNWKKAIKQPHIIITFCVSVAWFIGSWFIIKHFNQEPTKFLVYFDWLQSWKTALFHFISLKQLEFLLMIFVPFAFLPLFKPRYLLIGLFYYLELAFSFGSPIVNLHYGALLLIPGVLAVIFVLKDFENKEYKRFSLEVYRKISIIVLIVTTIYLNFFFGPWKDFNFENTDKELENYLIEKVDHNSKIVAPTKFHVKLIEKSEVYSVERAFWGNKQFSEKKYEMPELDYVLVDQNELVDLLFGKDVRKFKKDFSVGMDRIRELIAKNQLILIENWGNYMLFGKKEQQFNNPDDRIYQKAVLSVLFDQYEDKTLMIHYYQDGQKIKETFLQPFSSEIFIPIEKEEKVSLSLVEIKGHLDLNNLMFAYKKIIKVKEQSEEKFIEQ